MCYWHPVMHVQHLLTLDAAAQAEAMATTILPQLLITSPMLAATSTPALPAAMLKGAPVQPGGLETLTSRSLLTLIFWWNWFGVRSHEKLSWRVEERNAEDCHRASSLQLKTTCTSLHYLRHEGQHKSVFSQGQHKSVFSQCSYLLSLVTLMNYMPGFLLKYCLGFVPVIINFRTILNSRNLGRNGKSNKYFYISKTLTEGSRNKTVTNTQKEQMSIIVMDASRWGKGYGWEHLLHWVLCKYG